MIFGGRYAPAQITAASGRYRRIFSAVLRRVLLLRRDKREGFVVRVRMGDLVERFADGGKEKKLKRISGKTTSRRRKGSRRFHGLHDATTTGSVQSNEEVFITGRFRRRFQ